jgi:hypothetical protein
MRFGIHFGESAIKAFSKGNTILLILHTLVYTIGGTRSDLELIKLYLGSIGFIIIISFIMLAGYIYNQNSVQAYLGLKTMNLD